MTWAIWLIASIQVLMWLTLVSNLIYLRSRRCTRASSTPLPSLSVLIPARNELTNLGRLLPSLDRQDYRNFEVIVYDDASSDGTAELVNTFDGNLRLKLIRGDGPPSGWLGKVYALDRASRVAANEVFLFLDADTELTTPSALTKLVTCLCAQPAGSALTALPKLEGGGMALVSLVPHTILSGLPWLAAKLFRARSLGAVNGQAWMIRAVDYNRLRPHEHVKNKVLEDVEIGRYLLSNHVVPMLVDATNEVTVHMYTGLVDAWRGFRKNAYLLMGGRAWSFLFFLLIFAAANWLCVAVSWYLGLSAVAIKVATDRVSRVPWTVSVVAPVSFVLSTVLQIDSAIAHWTGRVTWKGRLIDD